MNTKNITQNSKIDFLWWAIFVILIIVGIGANFHFRDVAWALRATAGVLLVCVAMVIALQTTVGRRIWQFAKNSRMELRKVVWPTRQETIQTTALVVAMVVVMSLILWGVDSLLMWAISWVTGQRG